MNEPARHDLCTPPASFGGGTPPPNPDDQHGDAISDWLRWHAVELAGVGVPVALALAISAWFVLLAVPAAVLWASHEVRQTRGLPEARAALTSPDATNDAGRENNDE